MKKIALVLFILIFVVVSVSGCSSNNNTINNTTSQNSSNIAVSISYNGTWEGNIVSNSGNMTVNGSGDKSYDLGSDPGKLTVNIRKSDNGNSNLTVMVMKGGKSIAGEKSGGSAKTVDFIYQT